MKTATFIRTLEDWRGDARLYKLSEPHAEYAWDDEEPHAYDYVIVSAVNAMFSGPETYIFPSDENGEVINLGEMPGSYRGGWDHAEALANAGYSIETQVVEPKRIDN